MAQLDDALDRLRDVHADLGAVDRDRDRLMRSRDEALRQAKDAGASYEVIQQVTGLANATITKALRRE